MEALSWERCRDVRVQHAELVGEDPMRPDLSDGHETGIYALDWLRAN